MRVVCSCIRFVDDSLLIALAHIRRDIGRRRSDPEKHGRNQRKGVNFQRRARHFHIKGILKSNLEARAGDHSARIASSCASASVKENAAVPGSIQ